MMAPDIRRLRLRNQQIERTRFRSTGELVAHMGAVAQEYWGGKLGAGLRVAGGTDAGVERAVAAFEIVRSWPMRGTLHLVAAADLRWMLRLHATRRSRVRFAVQATRVGRKRIDARSKSHCECIEGRQVVTRLELGRSLRENGIETRENRGGHIMAHLAQEGTIVFGPHQGKQATFVPSRRVPPARMHEGEEAIVELTRRYFASHGLRRSGLLLVVGVDGEGGEVRPRGCERQSCGRGWVLAGTIHRCPQGNRAPPICCRRSMSTPWLTETEARLSIPLLPGWLQTGAYSLRLLLLGVRCWGRGNGVVGGGLTLNVTPFDSGRQRRMGGRPQSGPATSGVPRDAVG